MNLLSLMEPEREVDGWLISSNIPIDEDKSPRQRRKWERPKFPFEHLRPGDSFRWNVPAGMHPTIAQNLVSGAAATFREKDPEGRSFTTRQRGDHIRCWRKEEE